MPKIIEPEAVFSDKEIKKLITWISRYENPLLVLLRGNAEHIFCEFDRLYFQRTGMSENEYLDGLIEEACREASLRFTEMPSGSNETSFHYPEGYRQQAYRTFEARFLDQCAKEENRLRFKAYVARRYGLRVPFK